MPIQAPINPGHRDAAPAGRDRHGWRREGRALIRGVAAGSIIGIPLLYTMEMWWHGTTISEVHILMLMAAALGANFLFCLFSGFRDELSVREALSGSVTAVALGMGVSLAVLLLIGAVRFPMAWVDILGKVVIEAVPVSVGVSFANSQLNGKSREGDAADAPPPPTDPHRLQLRQDLSQAAATLIGAIVFSFNIAPTEEVVMIATRVPPWQHLLILAASLGLCYLILFASGFQSQRVYVTTVFQHPLAETVMAVAIALLVSAGLLLLVGAPQATGSVSLAIYCTVALGLPAAVGGAAGRLVI